MSIIWGTADKYKWSTTQVCLKSNQTYLRKVHISSSPIPHGLSAVKYQGIQTNIFWIVEQNWNNLVLFFQIILHVFFNTQKRTLFTWTAPYLGVHCRESVFNWGGFLKITYTAEKEWREAWMRLRFAAPMFRTPPSHSSLNSSLAKNRSCVSYY